MSATKKTSHFGLWTSIYVVFANMIGSGILTVPGPAWKDLGSPLLLLGLWTLGGFLALTGALTLAQMASAYTLRGGDYGLVRKAFGPRTGFVYGWSMILLGFAAPIALIAFTTINYLYPVFAPVLSPWESILGITSQVTIQIFATILIAAFAVGHSHSHARSHFIQTLTTAFKVGFLLALATLLIATSSVNVLIEQPQPLTSFEKVGTTLTQIMYAYTGWNGAIYLAAETKDAKTQIPRAILWGSLLVMAFYLFMNVAFFVAIPADKIMSASSEQLARISELAVSMRASSEVSRFVSMLIGLGVIASVSSYLLTGPRVCLAMAEDAFLPKRIASTRGDNAIPHSAVYLLAAVSILFLWSGTFEQVLEFTSFGIALFANLLILPIFELKRRPDFDPLLRGRIYDVSPYIFLFVNNAMLAAAFYEAPTTAICSTISVLIGFPIYEVVVRFQRQS